MEQTLQDFIANIGMTEKEVAEKLGVHQTLISAWSRGTSQPSALTLLRLANVLQVSTDELIPIIYKEEPAEYVDRPLDRKRIVSAMQTYNLTAAWLNSRLNAAGVTCSDSNLNYILRGVRVNATSNAVIDAALRIIEDYERWANTSGD